MSMDSVSGHTVKCQFCCDTGWAGYEKPMSGKDGRVQMVFVPQRCRCETGQNFEQSIAVMEAPKRGIVRGDD